jgi:hypothetical protein
VASAISDLLSAKVDLGGPTTPDLAETVIKGGKRTFAALRVQGCCAGRMPRFAFKKVVTDSVPLCFC